MLTASIVVYHTAEEELHRCLQSLLACEALRHVYVVDNGSEERLRQFCARQGERVSYRALPNVGYGAGHNSALREVVEEKIDAPRYHLVINSDVYFAPGTLERIVEHMEGHPEVGQLIPKVYYPDGRLQHVCRMLPTPADLWLRRFMPRWMSRRRMERYTLAFTGYDHPMNVPYHMGCFMFLRVEALREVGLFDERFFMYPEDIDLTRRMHRCRETLYFPEVSIIHAHRAESYKSRRMLRIHVVNMCRYFNKWGWLFDAERDRMNAQLMAREKQYAQQKCEATTP